MPNVCPCMSFVCSSMVCLAPGWLCGMPSAASFGYCLQVTAHSPIIMSQSSNQAICSLNHCSCGFNFNHRQHYAAGCCRSGHLSRGRSARARRRMSGALCTVWRAMRELGKPSPSLSFTSRKTSSSSMNHDFHVHHGGAEVRHTSLYTHTALPCTNFVFLLT